MMAQTRRDFLKAAGMGLALATSAGRAQAVAKKRKPNVVYIMADELGYYELSCMGNPNLKTPHVDRLAAEGVRFTQALAGSSVCAPTRFSTDATVSSPSRSGVPPSLTRTDVCPACLPVIRQQRVGAHTDDPASACVKRTPSAAMRSMFGVLKCGCPMQDNS